MTNVATHHREPLRYVSQSECKAAQDCGLAWYAAWFLGYKAVDPDNAAMRVGTLGHACLAEYVLGARGRREWSMRDAMLRAAVDKKYLTDGQYAMGEVPDELHAQMLRARDAATSLVDSPLWDLDPQRVVVPAFGINTTPLVEARLIVPWIALEGNAGLVLPEAFRHAFRGNDRSAAPHRLGMEGTPDVVHESADGVVYVDDYKFRTRPVDGGDASAPVPYRPFLVPDAQGAFYKTLLAGLLVGEHADVVFRQVNVYAGPWRTLDDFMEPGSPYVISSGLPTRDEKLIGGMVRPEVWAEAWRLLAERRRVASLSERDNKGRPKDPRLPTVDEAEKAKRFIEDLGRRSPVSIVATPRLDHSVCLEVVRDMLAAVAALLAQADSGATPGRNLRSYPQSPCSRPGSCRVQSPCLASLGSNNAHDVFADHAKSGRLTRLSVVPDVAEYDPADEMTS